MWDEVGDRQLFGPDLIKESEEKVKLIRDRLKVAQSRKKSYADSKRKEVVYEIGDIAYIRVSPLRGVKRFGVKGKLAPRFVGPYRVLEHMGEVASSFRENTERKYALEAIIKLLFISLFHDKCLLFMLELY